jgi:hypothetical protein
VVALTFCLITHVGCATVSLSVAAAPLAMEVRVHGGALPRPATRRPWERTN